MTQITLVIELAISITLLLSSVGKLRDPVGFARGIADYEILPVRFAYAFGLLVIPLEACLALMHLTGWAVGVAASIGVVMFACFAVGVGINLRRGQILPCRCFGDPGAEILSGTVLARLLLLLLGESALLFLIGPLRGSQLTYRKIANSGELGQVFLWTAMVLLASRWLLSTADLRDLLRSRTRRSGVLSAGESMSSAQEL